MARVTGPLMSMDASGTIAGAIVFSRWKGLPYVRRHAIPSNPRSFKQVSMRAMMTFLSRAWTGIGAGPQGNWSAAAETLHQSGFNRFVGHNQSRWRNFTTPEQDTPSAGPGVAPDAATVVVTGGVREALLAITPGANLPDFGWLIFGHLGAAPTPSISSLVGVIDLMGGNPSFTHTPIAAGVWHYITRGFNVGGDAGSDSADAFDTVT